MSAGITLLIGGVRAGKSARALSLAEEHSREGEIVFVATAQAFDDEMRRRIETHQRDRAAKDWLTIESPIDIADDIAAYVSGGNRPGVVIIDCLTLWVSNVLLTLPEDADAEVIIADRAKHVLQVLLDLRDRGTRNILVTNEVGLGVVPASSLGRRYRDALGRVNQIAAAASDETILMVAGVELRLK